VRFDLVGLLTTHRGEQAWPRRAVAEDEERAADADEVDAAPAAELEAADPPEDGGVWSARSAGVSEKGRKRASRDEDRRSERQGRARKPRGATWFGS
jgi:hypothetical protein